MMRITRTDLPGSTILYHSSCAAWYCYCAASCPACLFGPLSVSTAPTQPLLAVQHTVPLQHILTEHLLAQYGTQYHEAFACNPNATAHRQTRAQTQRPCPSFFFSLSLTSFHASRFTSPSSPPFQGSRVTWCYGTVQGTVLCWVPSKVHASADKHRSSRSSSVFLSRRQADQPPVTLNWAEHRK